MSKHYIGHATVKNVKEFDIDLLVKNLSENVKLRPIIKEKNDEIKKLLSSYGFTFQKLFFSPEGREILVDDKNKTLVCINRILLPPKYGILEVFIAYEKIPKWDKGISCPYFHILYAHINYFALPSPPLNSE